jgi:diacylglycerol kinase family enzyme
VLAPGDEASAIARAAEAEVLGVAGGDGSLADVAAVAIERDVPFVVVPFGTRNHFARDLGLDSADPLAAFAGAERRVDVGRAGGRLFLNNLSLGAYARLVREERRSGRLRAALRLLQRPPHLHVKIDGRPVTARIVVFGNNVYRLHPLELGVRERLDEGVLQLGIARGWLPHRWEERTAERFVLEGAGEAAIDGEPVRLASPVEVRVEPRALRLLV